MPLALLLAGCETTEQQVREQRQKQWQDDVGDQIADLNRSVELIRSQQAALDRRLNALETGFRSLSDGQRSLASLRSELVALKESTESKIRLIVEEVARENERLLSKIKTSQKASYAQGYEHTVQSGETLSDIARQYKTTVKAILDANQLANANALKVGQ
jgi:archaellum component FlaC